MAALPKQRNGALAFIGGLLAVLVIGGGVVALVKWKADTSLAPVEPASTATAAPSALVPPPPPPDPVVATPPPSAPVAAATAIEPATPVRASAPARPATPSTTPKSSGKAAAPTPTGKRILSNEL